MQKMVISVFSAIVLSSFVTAISIHGCAPAYSVPSKQTKPSQPQTTTAPSKWSVPEMPSKAKAGATSQFWSHWGDGKAELTGYKGTTDRYGNAISAEVVLVYVTETLHRKTLIKDDAAQGNDKISTLKLNHALKFRTGIYPYSVMTSVFTPVDQWYKDRFAPVKITFTGQEWCGHVFQGIWPAADFFQNRIHSYFSSEGETTEKIKTSQGTVYEDALFIQLRELSGAFKEGKNWKGPIVPTLWNIRKAHTSLRPVTGEIQRSKVTWKGKPATRFDVQMGSYKRTFWIETAWPRRILEWTTSNGEKMTLQKTTRLPYWSLHNPGDEKYLKQLGL